MSWLKKALVALATGGLSLAAKPAKQAVDTITGKKADKASRAARDLQVTAQDKAASRYEPYAKLGTFASGRLSDILEGKSKVNLGDIPGYQAGLDAGSESIRREAAAQGTQGGGTLAALFGFGQRYAGDAFSSYMNTLQNVTQIGSNAAGAQGRADIGAGESRAAYELGRGQRGSQLVGTLGGLAGMAIGGPGGGMLGKGLGGSLSGGGFSLGNLMKTGNAQSTESWATDQAKNSLYSLALG